MSLLGCDENVLELDGMDGLYKYVNMLKKPQEFYMLSSGM